MISKFQLALDLVLRFLLRERSSMSLKFVFQKCCFSIFPNRFLHYRPCRLEIYYLNIIFTKYVIYTDTTTWKIRDNNPNSFRIPRKQFKIDLVVQVKVEALEELEMKHDTDHIHYLEPATVCYATRLHSKLPGILSWLRIMNTVYNPSLIFTLSWLQISEHNCSVHAIDNRKRNF